VLLRRDVERRRSRCSAGAAPLRCNSTAVRSGFRRRSCDRPAGRRLLENRPRVARGRDLFELDFRDVDRRARFATSSSALASDRDRLRHGRIQRDRDVGVCATVR